LLDRMSAQACKRKPGFQVGDVRRRIRPAGVRSLRAAGLREMVPDGYPGANERIRIQEF